MSWAGFWIKLANAPARVGLCVTTYLSIKTLGQETPRNLFPFIDYGLQSTWHHRWIQ